MIDPKLNEVPAERAGHLAKERDTSPQKADAEKLKKGRSGLSINETIAGDASLSIGARGVDTSGVGAGSGAGAGMTMTTPTTGNSPAPNIVPGDRGTGSTPHGVSTSDQIPTLHLGTDSADSNGYSAEEVAARAYKCWHERGCPEGSPEHDWLRAEQELRAERKRATPA